MRKLTLVSLFSGAGGLDSGFEKAGFNVIWANEYDKAIWSTFNRNFPHTYLDRRSIVNVPSIDIPDAVGIIGGPPCQSWSEAGAQRGINDHRGQLFFEYIRVLRDKQPLFFLAENVSGILHPRHKAAFSEIIKQFEAVGYSVNYSLLNAKHYCVPEDRLRVIIIGYRTDLCKKWKAPRPIFPTLTLKDAIWDLQDSVMPALTGNKTNGDNLLIPNHEYMTGGYSTIYMSRNRVRSWNEPSFTIQAGGRHAPIHPQAPKMNFIAQNKRVFVPGSEHLYRRLSVRECARIQTFPDTHVFDYINVADGYKMVGNAVPVEFAYRLALSVIEDVVQNDATEAKRAEPVLV